MYGLKSKNLSLLKICPKTFFYQLLHYPFLGNLYIRFFILRFFMHLTPYINVINVLIM